jgi:proline iminopeptidase
MKTLNISIPERKKAPATTLFVKIVAEDEASLTTKPYIFMLPGGPGGNHSSYKNYSGLMDVGNIVFHDPRGCGLSNKGDSKTYTMDNYIQDVDVIRQHLGLEKIILLGKSYGAMCGVGYTLEFPNVVSKLILAAGSASFRNLETAKSYVLENGTDKQKEVFEVLLKGEFTSDEQMNHYFSVMDTFYSYKKKQGEAVTREKPEYPFAYEPLNQGFRDFLHNFDYEDRLHEINCNTLILVGEEDWITAQKHSEVMASKIPLNQFISFPKAGHSLELDVPENFFRAIKEFINS